MLIPSEFAQLAVRQGTVATVSDPHEIANVCGIEGVEFMLQNAAKVPFKFYFGAPSCVPATSFETAGATLDASAIEQLLKRDDIYYLSEMMNYPGVLMHDEEVMKKIAIAKKYGKPVDGHAPGLRGNDAKRYIESGISTDHECVTYEEALEKLNLGMKILIREGSAAKNFDALITLLPQFEHDMMFCCDDKHPDELLLHHINHHVKRALKQNINLFTVLRAACINPVSHYKLDVGLLQVGDPADFIVINHPDEFEILQTVIDGQVVFDKGQSFINRVPEIAINQFHCALKTPEDFIVGAQPNTDTIQVIDALDGQLVTKTLFQTPYISNGQVMSHTETDILKITVVNRYRDAPPALGFIHQFGLKRGAIASTVAHDSHNIICVGVSDNEICRAINALIACQGGIAVVDGDDEFVMPLPVAGLMSTDPADKVAAAYAKADAKSKQLGSTLKAPFMTLSFMALLVIPQLKLSDKGLFDGSSFCFTNLQQGHSPNKNAASI
jgi:adenine deaminase